LAIFNLNRPFRRWSKSRQSFRLCLCTIYCNSGRAGIRLKRMKFFVFTIFFQKKNIQRRSHDLKWPIKTLICSSFLNTWAPSFQKRESKMKRSNLSPKLFLRFSFSSLFISIFAKREIDDFYHLFFDRRFFLQAEMVLAHAAARPFQPLFIPSSLFFNFTNLIKRGENEFKDYLIL